jgi:nicotinamidase/pyrazinamidase
MNPVRIHPEAAILAVDIQNGFISERDELPVPGGAEVVPIVNRLVPRFAIRIASQDWHPADHGSFASNNPGRKPFDVGELGGVQQVYWPDHCVQGTRGAEFHPDFDLRPIQVVFRKGMHREVDSYSVFGDNAGRNPTGLDGYLRARGARELVLAGLALDYCVLFTARDARRFVPEIPVSVVLDGCRPVDPVTGEKAVAELRSLGVRLVQAAELGA